MKDNIIDLDEYRHVDPRDEATILRLKGVKLRLDLEHTKILISTSLLSIVILVTMANHSLSTTNVTSNVEEGGMRGVASVQTGTSNWEDQVAHQLAERPVRDTSHLGRKPSDLEKFTFGELGGKYSTRLDNGKILEVSYANGTSENDHPVFINDRAGFLKEHRGLLPVNFDKLSQAETSHEKGKFTESYTLLSKDNQSMAKIEFQLDPTGRMISMKVVDLKQASNI
jgi:hypothetical protein